jgi:hypothetical protein
VQGEVTKVLQVCQVSHALSWVFADISQAAGDIDTVRCRLTAIIIKGEVKSLTDADKWQGVERWIYALTKVKDFAGENTPLAMCYL